MSVRDRIRRMEEIAMQEREAAPDERGRSPGSNTSASGSPRPLSKVRTSFVAIADKEGRIGLARQPSGDSSFSERKLSGGETDTASSSILLDSSRSNVLSSSPDNFRSEVKRGPSGSFSRPGTQNSGAGPTSAAPPLAFSVSGPVSGDSGTPADPKSTPNPTTSRPVSASTGSSTEPASKHLTTTAPTASTSTLLTTGSSQKGLAASPQIRKASRAEEAPGQRPGGGSTQGQGQSVQESEARPARDQGQAQAKGRENTLDRAGHKDRSASGTAVASGTATLDGVDKAKTAKPATASSTQPKTAGKAPEAKGMTTPAAEKKPAEKKATPSSSSPPFVKPRPKSPTQPMKLPERLTTHTGASAAKSRNAPPTARPASRTSTNASGKGLGRSASVIGRKPHASFGPPPKQAVDHPVLKKEHKVDEGFLARMMRPTQAYANKVADKAQLPPKTPPRSTATKKPASGKTGPAKRVVSRSTTTSAAASPETSKNDHSTAVKPTAKREHPIAEEPIVAKKNAEKKEPSIKDPKKEELTSRPSNTAEKKTEPSRLSENKTEPSKPVEKEIVAKISEPKEAVAEANELKHKGSQSLGQEEEPSKSSDKVDLPKEVQQEQIASNTAKQPEPSPKKASDAMFEAFMNPETEKVDSTQTNGNHVRDDKIKDSSITAETSVQPTSNDDLDGHQSPALLASSDVGKDSQMAPPPQNSEEQEEW